MLDKRVLDASRSTLQALAKLLLARGVRANQVTVAGFIIGMMALPLLAFNQPLLALICILLNRLLDGLDGTLARLTEPTDRGGFLDIVLDFLFYSAIPLGFALGDPALNALPAAVLIYAFIGTGCSFLAFATIAAKRNLSSLAFPDKSFYYLGGLSEATETIFVFALMCVFPSWFGVFAYGFALICIITTFLRISAGMSQFK
jgi:phosphatidylglycerophosphate synthase